MVSFWCMPVHAVMLRANKQMRTELAKTTITDLARGGRPAEFEARAADWFRDRKVPPERRRGLRQ